jgi:cytochrome c-type biogenesis protein CcsB
MKIIINYITQQSGRIAFIILIMLVIGIGAASFIERSMGTAIAWKIVYGSWWLNISWCLLSVLALWHYYNISHFRNYTPLMLHLSLVIILIGALITRTSGKEGYIKIKKSTSKQHYVDLRTGKTYQLPFSIVLDTFEIITYPGTQTPADYQCQVSLYGIKNSPVRKTISMNKILRINGIRICQSSFDEDNLGVTLTVNIDPYGITVTYIGYVLLFLSSIAVLLRRKGRFRQLLKHPLLKQMTVMLILFILLRSNLSAQERSFNRDSLVITEKHVKSIEQLWTMHNNRICPIQTLANDFTIKITGQKHFKGFSSMQFLFGWYVFPDKWQLVPIIQVKNPVIISSLNIKNDKAAFADFFTIDGKYKLQPLLSINKNLTEKTDPLRKEVLELNEKIGLIIMMQSGDLLRIFPYNDKSGTHWFSPADSLPVDVPYNNSLVIHSLLPSYYHLIRRNQSEEALKIIDLIANYQNSVNQNFLPSNKKKYAEILYNRFDIIPLLFIINLLTGIFGLVYLIYSIFMDQKTNRVRIFSKIVGIISFIALTIVMFLVTYISGHFPISNGFETMLFLAWVFLLFGLLSANQLYVLQIASILLSGICLLVANLGMLDPQITTLVPVLQSIWLNLHVSAMMVAYALAGFVAFLGFMSLSIILFTNTSNLIRSKSYVDKLSLLIRILLYPCVFLMGTGIFLGAVWANESWGRYWAWDPKETWALITFIVYASIVHDKTINFLRNQYNICAMAFLSIFLVIMTYFGVNYFLGGMHSYAGHTEIKNIWWIIFMIVVIVVLIIGSYKKYRSFLKPLE